MATELGPDGQPPRFTGAAWVSQDGRWFWNGAAWQPVVRRGFRLSWRVIALAVVVMVALFGFLASRAIKPSPYEGDGVSNGKIDSATEIEFDYQRSSACKSLVFEYKFYDSKGNLVDDFTDTSGSPVDANTKYHFDIKANTGEPPIDTRAVRFEAVATCTN
jgi:hypothetical protein